MGRSQTIVGRSLVRAFLAAALAAVVVAVASRVAAEEPAPAAAVDCVERAEQLAASAGAVRWGEPAVVFLGEKESHVLTFTLEAQGCVGFLAVGRGLAKDLDLALHASSGVMVAQDTAQDAHPYIRYCGAADLTVHLVVQMYEGRGEVSVLPLQNAPMELRGLPDALSQCTAPSDASRALTDVGPEPPGPTMAAAFQAVSARLAKLGYRSHSVLIEDEMAERRRESRNISIAPGACYALVAIGDVTVEDMDLRVLSQAETVLLGEDMTRERTALVKVCPDAPNLTLDVRMYQGHGQFQVHAFVAQARGKLPAGVESRSQAAYLELSHAVAQRGMQVVGNTWALAQPGEQVFVPMPVRAGLCYAIGGVVGPELVGADLDLRVVDAQGRLLAWDLGPADQPLVFHCPVQDGVLRVVGEAHNVRGAGRFLILLAQDPPRAGGSS